MGGRDLGINLGGAKMGGGVRMGGGVMGAGGRACRRFKSGDGRGLGVRGRLGIVG